MKLISHLLSFSVFASLSVMNLACTGQTADAADKIFLGKIHTVDETQPLAEAVAIKANKIIFVGDADQVKKHKGEQTQIIELGNHTMIPGLIDGHGHFLGMGNSKLTIDLSQVDNFDEIVDIVGKAASKAEPGDWIIGRGWHQDKWSGSQDDFVNGFPTHDRLSQVSPENPLMFRHASGHSAIVNEVAMQKAGITSDKVDSLIKKLEGGEIVVDDKGKPTGILNERAMRLVSKHVPDDSDDTKMNRIMDLAIEECHKNGITSFHDAGVGQKDLDLYQRYLESGKLKVRLHTMLYGGDAQLLNMHLAKGPQIDTINYLLSVRAVKLWADGALGNRGAWLLEDYSDKAGWKGLETTKVEDIRSISNQCIENGFQLCIHAIGDRGNHEVLNAYETTFKAHPEITDARFRIEHAQHLNKDDIPRFAELNVLASMQSIHMASDRPWAIDRLGKERIEEGAYVWQKLLQSGAVVLNGTDVPVEPVSPIACYYAAVTRKTLKGTPEGGYEADQKMSRSEALKSYTLSAAYGSFEENVKGSIEVGKLADFAILDRDILSVPEAEILQTKVVMTVFNGEIVYKME